MNAAELITNLAAHGRYCFTTAEAGLRLERRPIAARAALRRLRKKGQIASPFRGFQVIVPPEYRVLGCLPPEQLIPELMHHLGVSYYAGLLSAAQFHGAAHHRPQQFQVVTGTNLPRLRCGRVEVTFMARRNVAEIPTVRLNTRIGVIEVSSPEATAVDLVGYSGHCGGLDNVATVLSELAEALDPAELARLAARTSPMPWAQRLGYLLELVGATELTGPLAELVVQLAPNVTPLAPEVAMRGVPRNHRWRVAVNVAVEPDR